MGENASSTKMIIADFPGAGFTSHAHLTKVYQPVEHFSRTGRLPRLRELSYRQLIFGMQPRDYRLYYSMIRAIDFGSIGRYKTWETEEVRMSPNQTNRIANLTFFSTFRTWVKITPICMHFNMNFIRHLGKIYELFNDAPWRFNFQAMSKYFRRIHIYSPAF